MIQKKKLFLAVLSVVFTFGPAAHGAAGFQMAQSYPVGTNPSAVEVGDFNGDGATDLAVCNFGDPTAGDDGNMSILLGRGDGTFEAATNFTGVKNCTGIAAGDFEWIRSVGSLKFLASSTVRYDIADFLEAGKTEEMPRFPSRTLGGNKPLVTFVPISAQ
jgi:hypothetical protein